MRLNTDVTLREFLGWTIDDRARYLDWLVGLPLTSRNPVERRWRAEWEEFERHESARPGDGTN